MECLRQNGYRIAGLLPLAVDTQWRQGRWCSDRVTQLQGASSFAFPASALCTTAQTELRDQPACAFDLGAVVDSHAVLATWVDIVVVDALGDPDGGPTPNMGDVAQTLGLPVVIACEDSEQGQRNAFRLVSRLRVRRLHVVAWVRSGLQPMACAAGLPCVGAIPPEDLRKPVRAARHLDVMRLMCALQSSVDETVFGVLANARKTGGPGFGTIGGR
jgi:hypothetical protein